MRALKLLRGACEKGLSLEEIDIVIGEIELLEKNQFLAIPLCEKKYYELRGQLNEACREIKDLEGQLAGCEALSESYEEELKTLRGIEGIANEFGIEGFVDIQSLLAQLEFQKREHIEMQKYNLQLEKQCSNNEGVVNSLLAQLAEAREHIYQLENPETGDLPTALAQLAECQKERDEFKACYARLTPEVAAAQALIDIQHTALEYASDLTVPGGVSGCDCLICEAIHAYNFYRGIDR